jgi:hypothetical protein
MSAAHGHACRCTSLEELQVTDTFNGGTNSTAAHFKGRGSSPEQRRLSLRQDLTAFSSPAGLLDPSSWPLCNTLASLSLQVEADPYAVCIQGIGFDDIAHVHHRHALRSAVNSPSLVKLEILGLAAPDGAPLLALLSSLRSLTHLAITELDLSGPASGASLQAGLSPLSRLQQLTLGAAFSFGATPLHLALPSSQLPCLTAVRLDNIPWDCGWRLELGAAQDLEVRDCSVSVLAALSACPNLTRLVQRCSDPRFRDVGAPDGDGLSVIPARWGEGLRSLALVDCCADTLAWVEQLRGLTSLDLYAVSMTPAFFRCAPLGAVLLAWSGSIC